MSRYVVTVEYTWPTAGNGKARVTIDDAADEAAACRSAEAALVANGLNRTRIIRSTAEQVTLQ